MLNISEFIGVVYLDSFSHPQSLVRSKRTLLIQYHSSSAGKTVYHYADVKPKLTQPVYNTVEPGSAHQENQPQYEVPVPQVHKTLEKNSVEVSKME